MSNKRILHIITRLDKGGSSENTLLTVAHLGRERATLIAGRTHDPEGRVKAFIEEHDIECIFMNELVREITPLSDLKAFWKLFRFMRKNKYDIVHTHSSKAGILGRWAAWCAGVKTIIHTPHGHIFYGYYGWMKTQLFILVERLTALITDKIITLTERGKQDHVDIGIAQAHKFVAIPSGICIEDYMTLPRSLTVKQTLGIPENATVVGTVSRLDPIKGNRYFLEAINYLAGHDRDLLENTHFLFIGDGTEGLELRELAYEYGLTSKITFAGMREDMKDIYPIIDIFVLASLMEGMGRVIIETMAQGKPVIGTNVGGIPELINSGETGILVQPRDPEGLAMAIKCLLLDPALAAKMGAAGMRFVCGDDIKTSRFSILSMLKNIDTLYQEYLEVNA